MRVPLVVLPIVTLLAGTLPAQGLGLKLRNGVDGHVDIPYHPTIVPQSGITLEAWVTFDESTLGPGYRWPTVVRQNTAPGSESYLMRVDAGSTVNRNLRWYVRTAAGSANVLWQFGPGQLLPWTHLAGTWDGATARLLVNGVEVGSATSTGPILDTGGILRIGNGDLSAPGAETWNGEIDEVRLWPLARSAAEIAATMPLATAFVPGEASTWNLDVDALDSSGSNHGTLQGAAQLAPNSLVLQPFPVAGAVAFGNPTTGCAGRPRAGIGSLPRIGNGAFAVTGLRTTASGAGILWLAFGALSSPLRVAGAEIWVDPAAPGLGLPARLGLLAEARASVPLPANPWLVGQGFFVQMLFVEPGCAVPLLATDALAVTIFP